MLDAPQSRPRNIMDQMSDSAQDTQTPNTPELLSDEVRLHSYIIIFFFHTLRLDLIVTVQIKYHYVSSPPSSISTNTHDISRARYHMKELETFAVRVEEVKKKNFTSIRYSYHGPSTMFPFCLLRRSFPFMSCCFWTRTPISPHV